jgi:hypothetical protein
MDIKVIAGLISAVLPFIAYAPYLRDTWRGKTRPHPISWLSWSIATATLTLVLAFNGGGAAVWFQLSVLAIEVTICLLAFLHGGRRDIKPGDLVCFGASMVALICWGVADQSALAMSFLAASGVIGLVPMLRKAWAKPHEETLFTWPIQTITAAVNVFALAQFTYTTLVNPIANIFVNLTLAAVIFSRRQVLPFKPVKPEVVNG